MQPFFLFKKQIKKLKSYIYVLYNRDVSMVKTKNMLFSVDYRIAERLESARKEYGLNKSAIVQILLDEFLTLLESKQLNKERLVIKNFGYFKHKQQQKEKS